MLFGSLFASVVRENRCVPPKRVRLFFCHFCLKIVQILGPAFWTKVGHGLGAAVEGIYIFF